MIRNAGFDVGNFSFNKNYSKYQIIVAHVIFYNPTFED